jgi:hypothetical protein
MSLYTILTRNWEAQPGETPQISAISALERGDVLFLPSLGFDIRKAETSLFTPAILGAAKNASFDPRSGRLSGATVSGTDSTTLQCLMARFSAAAASLADQVFPAYRGRLVAGRASFRPVEVAGRVTTWRKDDTRLHVDSFPATPSGGRRILRVFTNVNPEGRPRSWRIGDDFRVVAERFAPRLHVPLPGVGHALAFLRVTKTPRSAYDALMLQLHDAMKADEEFQCKSPQTAVDFPAGSTWVGFTDQVSHAATAGQYQLEQTLLLPVDAMLEPERSPLRVLERLKGRRLA